MFLLRQGVGTAGPYAVCLSPVGPKMALNGAELLPVRDREQITGPVGLVTCLWGGLHGFFKS